MLWFGIPTGGRGHGIWTLGVGAATLLLVADLVEVGSEAAETSMVPKAATIKVTVSFMLIIVGFLL